MQKKVHLRNNQIDPWICKALRIYCEINSKEEWMNRMATGKTEKPVYKEMTHPKRNDSINKLSRPNLRTIFQLMTTHTRVNFHLNRLNPEHAENVMHHTKQ